MKMFKNGVGRPSNLTIRRRRNFLICMTVILGVLLCFTVTYTIKYFAITSGSKNISGLEPIIPVYTTGTGTTPSIKPTKTVNLNVTGNGYYTAGQGMTRVDINGKWYILTAVVQDSRVNENVRASTPTYIYIVNESNSKVEAIVADYSYAHANSMAYDGKYIYIWRAKQTEKTTDGTESVVEDGKLLVLDKKYVSDAISRGGKITQDFTKKYLIYGESLTGRVSLASLTYDKQKGKLYGSNKANFYEINIVGSGKNARLETRKIFKQEHFSTHYRNDGGRQIYAMTNAGAAIYKDYLFLGRYYTKGIPGSSGKKNSIDIFKVTRDSSGTIISQSYVASYVFNEIDMKSGEIEDLEVVDDNTIAVHYNYSRSVNKIFYLNLKQLNYTKVKVWHNGKVVPKNVVTATVYNSNNKVVGTYKPNENGNLVVRNLPVGKYKAVITAFTGNKKTGPYINTKGKTVNFEVKFYNPYQVVRFDI